MATDDRTGSLGFEDKLWNAADLLRNNMDPAEYKPRRCRRTPIRSEQGLLHNSPVRRQEKRGASSPPLLVFLLLIGLTFQSSSTRQPESSSR